MEVTPQVLLDDYNFYRAHTHSYQQAQAAGEFRRMGKLTEEKSALLERTIKWCAQEKFDARLWIYALFARQRWMFAPKWTAGTLMSPNGKAWFKANARKMPSGLFRERLKQTRELEAIMTDVPTGYESARDLSAEVEARKRRRLEMGGPAACMDALSDAHYPTQGWHPKSTVCRSCVQAELCKGRLRAMYPFDVVALREGALTMTQARRGTLNGAESV